MYLIAQIWWLLFVAFFVGTLAGYLVWRACSRPRLESRYAREQIDLAERVRHLEKELAAEIEKSGSRPTQADAASKPADRGADLTLPAAQSPAPETRTERNGLEASAAQVALTEPRGSLAAKSDNLKLIRGIGPRLEKILNSMGIYRFDQIASWTTDDLAKVDQQLGDFSGRAIRDKWVEQSRHLLAGGSSPKSGKYTH